MSELLLGPRRDELGPGIAVEETGTGLRLQALRDLEDIATGRFDQPRSFVAWRPAAGPAAAGLRVGGLSYTQFGFPAAADAELGFRFEHPPVLFSPHALLPVWLVAEDGRAGLLAPLDGFHEQVVAVQEGELRWGWQGDLERVPRGFSTELLVLEGSSVRELLARWGEALRARAGTERPGRYADPVTSHLSYWTDNGAAYWYRTEPGVPLAETLARKADELRAAAVPVHAFELDSWFYPHEKSRPVQEIGYLEAVPPSGMLRWEPREDVLPEGIPALRQRLGAPPLVLHSRHVSAKSPYLEAGGWWTHHGLAHPQDPAFFRRWLADARAWGATTYEQDWMSVIWFGMRPLRQQPGRARAWQRGLDAAAREQGLGLVWCMPTPADLAAAVELERVVAVRTCDDYRYGGDPAILWSWFLVVNAVASALGLWPFKDVFLSWPEGEGIDGDPNAPLEAALAALSAGPVGIGDRLGRTDAGIVARTCRADGLLVKPDRPLAALDGCLLGEPRRGERLLWADAASGAWRYVLAIHTGPRSAPLADRLALGEPALVYDWRAGTAEIRDALEAELQPRDWRLWVCCPLREGTALVGDPQRYATMGDRRVRPLGPREAEVLGAPGEAVTLRWWHRERGLVDARVQLPASGRARVGCP